jgi:flotillin
MFGYRVPAPDEAMLVSGGKHSGQDAPFRVIVGHGAFVMPGFRKARLLTLALRESEVAEQCVTKQGIALNVRAVIAFKVGNDEESIVNAGQRFLSDQDQMSVLTGRIFAGHLRSIVGSMTVEEIVTERQKLATEVLDGSKVEMAKIGLIVDSLQIQSIDDRGAGYIDAMAAPNNAAIQRQAKIAQTAADQAAAEAQQASQRKQAEYARETAVAQSLYGREQKTAEAQAAAQTQTATAQAAAQLAVARAEAEQQQAEAQQASQRKQAEYARQTSVVQAQYKAEVDKAQAEADQAGPLAQASAQRAVIAAQADLATQQAELRQQQLITEVVRPAEAEAERTTILARAEAEKRQILAEAAQAGNRVALDQMLIEQLPAIVEKTAAGLAGANLTVLNGADGLADVTASLVSQGLTILDTLRRKLPGDPAAGNGQPPAGVVPAPAEYRAGL